MDVRNCVKKMDQALPLTANRIETVEQSATTPSTSPARRKRLNFAYFGLLLFMTIYFARPEDWIPGLATVPLAKIAAGLVLIALFFSFVGSRWRMPSEVTCLILLVAQLWLAALLSPIWMGGAVNQMLDFSKILPLMIVIYLTVHSMKRLRWMILVQVVSVAGIAITSIVHAHVLRGRLQGALSGMYGNPNDLALIIDLTLPLCLAFALTSQSHLRKWAWAAVMLAMIYVVALTVSRAGTLAFLAAALVCLWHLGIRRRRLYLLLFIPASVALLWLSNSNGLRERFEQTVLAPETSQGTEASGSSLQRKELFLQSLRISAEYPLFGVGPGNFEIVSGVWHVTHNSYTQMSAEGGIPAFLLYLFILGRGLSNIRYVGRRPRAGKNVQIFSMAIGASLAAYLVGSFFSTDGYQMFPYCLIAYSGTLRFIVQQAEIRQSPVQVSPVPSAPANADVVWI